MSDWRRFTLTISLDSNNWGELEMPPHMAALLTSEAWRILVAELRQQGFWVRGIGIEREEPPR